MGYYINSAKNIVLCVLLLTGINVFSQEVSEVVIINHDKDSDISLSSLNDYISKANLTEDKAAKNALNSAFLEKGYLSASIDSIVRENNHVTIYIYSGSEYYFRIKSHNLTKGFLIQHNKAFLPDEVFPFSKLPLAESSIISYYEDNGYPMASISREDISISNDTIEFRWVLDKGELFMFKEVIISGDVDLQPSFISGLTRIRKNTPYSETKIKNAAKQFSGLEFLTMTSEPAVMFTHAGAKVEFPVERIKSNRFDGIAGLMSVPGTENETDYRITGQLNLFLINSLGHGETLDIQWQAAGESSQQIYIDGSYPHILSTPIEAGYNFYMNKQDTTFLLVRHKPKLSFKGANIYKFSTFAIFETNNIFVNDSDTHNLQYADYQKSMYGIEIKIKSGVVDHSYNNGFKLVTSFAAGIRNIDNTNLNNNSIQYTSESMALYHTGIGRQSLLANSLRLNLQAGEKFLDNELYRIGGLRTLKGFDENSITCSSYGIFSTEYRFYMAEDSFLSMLANFAWIERNSLSGYYRDFPWGLAAGINFKTRPGIISVYYALGKQSNQSFQFQNAKIHVGFISIF